MVHYLHSNEERKFGRSSLPAVRYQRPFRASGDNLYAAPLVLCGVPQMWTQMDNRDVGGMGSGKETVKAEDFPELVGFSEEYQFRILEMLLDLRETKVYCLESGDPEKWYIEQEELCALRELIQKMRLSVSIAKRSSERQLVSRDGAGTASEQ
jgi:hypothetical protein